MRKRRRGQPRPPTHRTRRRSPTTPTAFVPSRAHRHGRRHDHLCRQRRDRSLRHGRRLAPRERIKKPYLRKILGIDRKGGRIVFKTRNASYSRRRSRSRWGRGRSARRSSRPGRRRYRVRLRLQRLVRPDPHARAPRGERMVPSEARREGGRVGLGDGDHRAGGRRRVPAGPGGDCFARYCTPCTKEQTVCSQQL